MEIITKMHEVLNNVKGFEAGYSTKTMDEGYMMIIYKGKPYAVKIKEVEDIKNDLVTITRNLQYYV